MSEGLTKEQQALFDALTPLNQRFALNLTIGMGQGQAYKAAGGTAKDIYAGAAGLLRNPKIMEFVKSVRQAQTTEAIMSRDEMLRDYTRIARYDWTRLVISNKGKVSLREDLELTSADVDMIAEWNDGKVKLRDKEAARKAIRDMEGYDTAYRWDRPAALAEDGDQAKPDDLTTLAADLVRVLAEGVNQTKHETDH